MCVSKETDTWYNICITRHISSYHYSPLRIMFPCLPSGRKKSLLTTWHQNLHCLRQVLASRSTHSSSQPITKPPLALVYTEAQGCMVLGPSSFLCMMHALICHQASWGRVLKKKKKKIPGIALLLPLTKIIYYPPFCPYRIKLRTKTTKSLA